jgi:aminopeptidase YwaD
MLDSLSDRLQEHLGHLVRERNPFFSSQGHFYVKEYLRQEFKRWGEVSVHPFQFQGNRYENISLDLPAREEISHKPPILIGAHYDTVPGSPGADDNGSGLAVLLELASFFGQEMANFPIRLVAFDLEEYGLRGSIAYAESLKQQKQDLRLMISLEMLGYCDEKPDSQAYPPFLRYFYPSTGNFIGLIGNWSTLGDLRVLGQKMQENNTPCQWLPVILQGYIVPDTRRSDHSPFWSRGYRAIMVTDTANMRNPHYHSARDTIATLDLHFLSKVCQGLARGIQSLS